MENNKEIRQAVYHELGHLFLAFLYFPEFPFSKFVCNKAFLSEEDKLKGWRGGMTFNLFLNEIIKSTNASDKFISICFGGLCTQNLYDLDKTDFKRKIEFYLISPFENMNTDGVQEDYDMAKPFLLSNQQKLKKTQLEYLTEILSFNFNFFSQELVWNSLEEFADIIFKNKLGMLTDIEAINIARNINFGKFLKYNAHEILKSRYPIK